jgi:hypothetical protein
VVMKGVQVQVWQKTQVLIHVPFVTGAFLLGAFVDVARARLHPAGTW